MVLPVQAAEAPAPEMTAAPSRLDRVFAALFTARSLPPPVPPEMENRRLGTFLPSVVL